jgi:microcystin-dependent protein
MNEISNGTWSEVDASNNAATPNGWPEGQSPSSVNDCARMMMGAVKRFWGRIQGQYAATGSADAYVLTPASPLAVYVTGERYSFRANFTNAGAATLDISGLGAKALKKMRSAGKADLGAGDIQTGQPVTVEYDGTDMVMVTPSANAVESGSPSLVPVGAVMPFAGSSAPAGWLLADGAAVSRTTYAALFAAIGATYGAGDGSTTFNLPDLRGRVVAGKEAPASRLTSSGGGVDGGTLGATGGTQTHTLTLGQMPLHDHDIDHNLPMLDSGVNAVNQILPGNTSGLTIKSRATGGSQPHPNVQPTIILNYIIKT